MLQLNPTIPIVRRSDGMKGYAYAIIDYSQEHYVYFVCGLDNGDIWVLSNKDLSLQSNVSLDRKLYRGENGLSQL
jgi:hypothetical protein